MKPELYPALNAPSDGYVFVVTYGRSGSTLTQTLLNSIPGYCIRGENGNLPYHLARAVAVTSSWDNFVWRRDDWSKPREQQRDFLRDIIGTSNDPWYGAENVDPHAFARSLMDVFVREVLCLPAKTRAGGFKEIRFHQDQTFFPIYLQILRDGFPKARFLFQIRDHVAVSKSSWWANKPEDEVIKQLTTAESMFRNFSQRYPEDCFTIDYDRYAEGSRYVKEIMNFLREPFDAACIEGILGKNLRH